MRRRLLGPSQVRRAPRDAAQTAARVGATHPVAPAQVAHAVARVLRGISGAIRARPKVFAGVVAGVFLFDLVAPVVILSLARRPLDFFTFNPWLSRLPGYLVSDTPLAEKVAFLPRMAIAWTSSDSPVEGLEWGVVIDVPSLARILVTSLAVWLGWSAGDPSSPERGPQQHA